MRRALLLSLLVLVINTVMAIPMEVIGIKFDVKNANQKFDQINLKLSVQNLNREDLDIAVATLTELDDQAEQCIAEAEKKLSNLNDLAIQSGEKTSSETRGVDKDYLNGQKKALVDHQAECRLFSIRAKEAIGVYRTAASQLVKQEALVREIPLWTNISKLTQECYQHQCTLLFNPFQESSLIFPILILFSGYCLLSFVIYFGFKTKLIRAYLLLSSIDRNFARNLAIVILNFGLVGFLGYLLAPLISVTNGAIWVIYESLYLFSLLGTSLYFCHYFCAAHPHYYFVNNHRKFIMLTAWSWVLICVTANIVGFHYLAVHLVFSGLTTVAIVLITLLLCLGVHNLYLTLYSQRQKMAYYFGYRPEQLFVEFFILKIIIQILMIAVSVYLIGESLDFATYAVESLYFELLNGIHIASIIVYPTLITSGLVAFCLLFLIFRVISRIIIRHHNDGHEGEEETQVALASIATYVGFSLSLIAGLMIAGFNFTGLAIVAGALSVGIGLGLQSIVNNFVSGLILLIEKPIRPGDRINVDGVEGVVKKIRVRSTQIITSSREDIIIPNSDLITRRVTNYMLTDKHSRICCEITVAYGTDTHLVRDTLLNCANLQEDVVKTGRYKPTVLFRSFGDNILSFQLWCLIKDVSKKSAVHSDLNYAIEEGFRKQNISIGSNQQELHVNISNPLSVQLQGK